MATRIGKDLRVRYDTDRGGDAIVAQRQYGIRFGGADVLLTPITPSFQSRVLDGVPVDRQRLVPRNAVSCIPNDSTAQGFSELKTVIPFLPGSFEHLQQLKEMATFSNGNYSVTSIKYFGESK